MSNAFSFVTILRVFYTAILIFLTIVLLREVWFVWFDRQMTIGEIKYFDGIKVEPAAAERFRHLLSHEYNRHLDLVRNYGQIFQTITGRAAKTEPDLLRLEGNLEPAILSSAKSFESFAPKEREFAALDISFQGIDFKKLFSSFRTYLSPSVDLNLVVTKNSAEDIRVNIRWPREGRSLEGLVGRFLAFEIGPFKNDAVLAQKASCYLLWLQAFNKEQKDLTSFREFCLWFEGLNMLGALADAKNNLAVDGGPDKAAVTTLAEQFVRGFRAEFDYAETYRVGATLISEATKKHQQFAPEITSDGKRLRVDPKFLAAALNYYYVHLISNPSRREFFRSAAEGFADTRASEVDPEVVGRRLLADRVVPWSRIAPSLEGRSSGAGQSQHLEATRSYGPERFHSADIGPFGFPRREVSSLLRDLGPDGQWRGTAFLVAPDIALASGLNPIRRTDADARGLGYVEYVLSPYMPGLVNFQRVAVKEVVPLITAKPAGVVALRLEAPVPGATPFRIADYDQARKRTGESVYLLSYLLNVAKSSSPLDAVFNGEFERPTYLGATILLQTDTESERQYAYDAFTLPGATGSPVVDAGSGQVIAMHHSGLIYSGGIMKIAVGVDITSLRHNATLNALIDRTKQDRASSALGRNQ